jgi:8-oxo-dGTP pyrophosphatase MutT (NUDIX family)
MSHSSDDERNPWRVLSTRPVYDNPWISVVEHQVLTPAGTPGLYGIVSPKKLALGVVPFTDDGKIVLVGQYRFALNAYSWEIPEGGGDKAVPPQQSAARELKEETGYTASNWQEILRLHLSNSVCDEMAVSFLAWNLVPGEAIPDETELLSLRHVPFAEALGMVMDGTITDAITVASLLKVKALASQGNLPDALMPHIR